MSYLTDNLEVWSQGKEGKNGKKGFMYKQSVGGVLHYKKDLIPPLFKILFPPKHNFIKTGETTLFSNNLLECRKFEINMWNTEWNLLFIFLSEK